MNKPNIIFFNKIGEPEIGYISVAEINDNIPFVIKRVYWTYFTPNHVERGNHAHKEIFIKRNLPLLLKKIFYKLFGENSKYYKFLMNRKLKPFKANVNDEKFIYSFIKDDQYKLDKLGFLFDDWKTVKKYHK